MDCRAEGKASQLFHLGHYKEALQLYSTIYDSLPTDVDLRVKVNILLNRSACYLKLKAFSKVLEDCNNLLILEADNSKALTRKSKVLCSLGRFLEAHQLVKEWKQKAPHNDLAAKEYQRLDIIIKALNDQDGEDSLELPSLVSSRERVPPDGQEDLTSIPPLLTMTTASIVTTTTTTATTTTTNTTGNSKPISDVSKTANIYKQGVSSSNDNGSSVCKQSPNHSQKKNLTSTQTSQLPVSLTVESGNHSATNVSSTDMLDVVYPSKAGINCSTAGMEIFYCKRCGVRLESKTDYDNHCLSLPHVLKNTENSTLDKIWKFRPPPRGLTDKEYSICPRFTSLGNCQFGAQCSHAHSVDELAEWCERFQLRTRELKRAQDEGTHGTYQHVDAFMEKLLSTDDPKTMMKEDLEGINVHLSCEQNIHLSTKKAAQSWMFTLTTRVSLKHAMLLDDTNRKQFHISSITVGPKRQQKSQHVQAGCQEWSNPNYTAGKSPNEKVYRIKVIFNTEIYGTFRQSIVFDFGEIPVLVRQLCVDTTPIVDIQKLSETLILQEGGRWDLTKMTVIEIYPKPFHHDEVELALLEKYPPPIATKFVISSTLLQPTLSRLNYKARMHCLLNLEEMAQFSSIAKFNIKTTIQLVDRFMLMPSTFTTAKFAHGGELFACMQLNGDVSEDTAHGRLILQNVNNVYLAPHREGDKSAIPDKVYEAVVEEKGKNFIFLRLSSQCVSDYNMKKDSDFVTEVQFHLNRLPICQMHMALENLSYLDIVFPGVLVQSNIPWTPQKLWKETLDHQLNAKQKEAIVAITSDIELKLPPILIVGPYGTGKTFTLAQATKTIICQENTRVLICTHSNSAADLYIKDYLHPFVQDNHPEAKPLRVYYKHRWLKTVHPTVLQYCLVGTAGEQNGVVPNYGPVFRHPTIADMESVRVVVSTLGSSQYVYHKEMEPDFFTHILLDEAAQAMECESLLPLGLAGPNTRVVLAGDHMQMSPEIHSEFAQDREFHMSLLERLYEIYPDQHPCKILLCENYRSHKAIIDFTSDLFYDNKLVASGKQPRHDKFYPLTFFSARGEEVQHQNSTTFYNNAEVYETVECVGELTKCWPKCWGDMDESSIGVLSPYSDQVQRIRSELRKRKMKSISVERVLNVQGKQFRVVLLSTVRTRHSCSMDANLEDLMDYGFLSNAKLLNTAITRAQSLVIVVGDPIALATVGKCRKIWERFLDVCNNNGSFHGMTWSHLRAQLDGVELKKTYILNPLAPEFIPNRLCHGSMMPPLPVAYGKYGYMFTDRSPGAVMVGMRPRWPPMPLLQEGLPQRLQVSPKMIGTRPMFTQIGAMQHFRGPAVRHPPPVPHFPVGAPLKPPLVGSPLSSSPLQGSSLGFTGSPTTRALSQTMKDSEGSVSSPQSTSISPLTPLTVSPLTPLTVATSLPGVLYATSSPQSHNHLTSGMLTGAQLQKLVPVTSSVRMSVSPRMMPTVAPHGGGPLILQQRPPMAEVRPYHIMPQQNQPMIRVAGHHMPHVYGQPVPLHQGQPVPLHQGQPVPLHQGQPVPLHQGQPVPLHQGMYAMSGPPAQPRWGVVNPGTPTMYSSYPVKPAKPTQPVHLIAVTSAPQYQPVTAIPPHVSLYTQHPVTHHHPVVSAVSQAAPSSQLQQAIPTGLGMVDNARDDPDSRPTELDSVLSSKGTAFFQNLWIQQELYSYMVQTEGKDVASQFISNIQKEDNSTTATTHTADIDVDDSSIIAISHTNTVKAGHDVRNGLRGCKLDERTQSPLEMMLHQQQQQIIESAYRSTVPQTTHFTGPYSLQRKQAKMAAKLADADTVSPEMNSPQAKAEEQSSTPASTRASTPASTTDSSVTTESEDPLRDTYMVADSVVKFLEDSLEDQPLRAELATVNKSLESELMEINSRPRPLYMRGQNIDSSGDSQISPSGPMTYAGALQKTTALPETPSPEPLSTRPVHRQLSNQHLADVYAHRQDAQHMNQRENSSNIYDPFGVFTEQRSQPMMPSPIHTTPVLPPANPLDVLRNLNIKASPSTQALFDYFA